MMHGKELFMSVKEVLERGDVTYMTKVALKAMLSSDKKLLYSDEEYKIAKGADFTLYI